MDADFWLQRWRDNRIGFHQPDVNPDLIRYWPQLGLEAGGRVLVPLCGKSRDMCWLAERHRVFGVELSPVAIDDFFSESGLQPSRRDADGLTLCEAGTFTLLCGDFFDLRPDHTRDVAAVYDRAALIALPPAMRPAYAGKLSELTAPGTAMLLITLEYDQPAMDGPPFSVEADEVQDLFAHDWRIQTLHSSNILDAEPRFRARGLSRLSEHIYLLVRQLSP